MGIKRQSQREKLAPSNVPYWEELARGLHLGYRKTQSGRDSWNARLRINGKYFFKGVGGPELEWEEAKAAAEAFAAEVNLTGTPKLCSVEEICKDYIETTLVGETKYMTESSFKRVLYGTPFSAIRLNDLRPADVKTFRNGLLTDKRGPDSANRILRMLKAALNLAHREQRVASNGAWSGITAIRDVDDKRTEKVKHNRVYLTVKERQQFIKACPADLADFVRGLLYTGARPGELARAKLGDLDLVQNNLRLVTTKGSRGKERVRFVDLPPGSEEFFKRVATDKLPEAFLFMRSDGSAWCNKNWNTLIRRAVRPVCTLPATHARIHNLRHSAITDWLIAGMELLQVTGRAGTSVKMIELHYAKYIKSHVRDVLANMQAF